MIDKIIRLSKKRIPILKETKPEFYKGYETFLESMLGEIDEAHKEMRSNNHVYLEDELGDIFWTYLCLLRSLEDEKKITSIDKVFERCYKKFTQRINEKTGYNNGEWREIKKRQKINREKEHQTYYEK